MTDTHVVPLRTGNKITGIIPQTIEEVFRLATAISKSGMAPKNMDKPEALTVAIMHGLEIGLPPMQAVQRIAVVNGRPTVWGDALPALLWARNFSIREWTDGEGDKMVAYCTVTRPTGEAITKDFGVTEAKKAGLWGKPGPWQLYPARMLAMRARAFACRDGAADVLAGLYISEEMVDVDDMKDITPRKSSAAAKRDGTTETFNAIRAEIASAKSADDLDTIRDKYAQEIASLPRAWFDMVSEDDAVKRSELQPEAAE